MWSGEEVPVVWRDTFYDFQTIWRNILENYDLYSCYCGNFTFYWHHTAWQRYFHQRGKVNLLALALLRENFLRQFHSKFEQ